MALGCHATLVPSAFGRRHHGPGQFRLLTAGEEDLSPANRSETWRIVVAEKASTTRLGKAQGSRIPKNRGWDTPLLRGGYSSMIPRFSPIVTACVRSFAPSFERMFLTCPLTVSSVIDNFSAISLLAFPAAIALRTSISRGVKVSSAT